MFVSVFVIKMEVFIESRIAALIDLRGGDSISNLNLSLENPAVERKRPGVAIAIGFPMPN